MVCQSPAGFPGNGYFSNFCFPVKSDCLEATPGHAILDMPFSTKFASIFAILPLFLTGVILAETGGDALVELDRKPLDPGALTAGQAQGELPPEAPPLKSPGGFEANSIRILFAGDTHFLWGVKDLQTREGALAPIEGIRRVFKEADYRIINLETVVAGEGRTVNHKPYVFRSDPDNLAVLRELGVEGLFLANNHTYDLGQEGVQQTLDHLRQSGLVGAGIGKTEEEAIRPWVVQIQGINVAVFSLNLVGKQEGFALGKRGGTAYPTQAFFEELHRAHRIARYVIVGVHWGNEYELFPNAEQQNLGHRLIREGADAVIGHHPHVPQGVEFYAGKPIVYSLGNFLFGSANYQQTHNLIAVVRIDRTDGKTIGLELHPIVGRYRHMGYAVSIVPEEERVSFWQEIFLLNRKLNPRQKMILEDGMRRMVLSP